MPLPARCPKSGNNNPCLSKTCPMYVTDWRSGDEYCAIGYERTSSRNIPGEPVEDTYVRDIPEINKGDNPPSTGNTDGISSGNELPPASIKATVQSKGVIEIQNQKNQKSRDFIRLKDIPDDYEAQFWS